MWLNNNLRELSSSKAPKELIWGNSKLTKVLQSSLSEGVLVAYIFCASRLAEHNATIETLKMAKRSLRIVLTPKVKVRPAAIECSRCRQLKGSMTELQLSNGELKAQLETQLANLQHRNEAIDAVQDENTELKRQCNSLQLDLELCSEAVKALHSENNDKEKENSKCKFEVQRLEKELKESAAKHQSLEESVTKHQTQVQSLEESNLQLQSELEREKEGRSQLVDEMERLQACQVASEASQMSELHALQEENADLRTELEAAHRVTATESDAEQRLKDLKLEYEAAQTDLEEAKLQIESISKAKSEVERSLTEKIDCLARRYCLQHNAAKRLFLGEYFGEEMDNAIQAHLGPYLANPELSTADEHEPLTSNQGGTEVLSDTPSIEWGTEELDSMESIGSWLDSPTIDPTQGTVKSTVRLLFVQFRTIGWILDSHVHSRFLPNISQAPVDDSTPQAFGATMIETPDVLPSTFPSASTEKPPPRARPKVALTGAGSKRRSKSTPRAPVAPTRENVRRSCKDRSTTKQGP